MKKDKIKEILDNIFEEDESLKYALATNLAKYGRPQSKKSDKPAKLTKGLEKGREKYVKDLKKAGLDEVEGVPSISPMEASKIHKFITNKLRVAVNDYNESLGTGDTPIRMSFFEQEFPLASQFYDSLNQALTENLNEELEQSFILSDLDFEIVDRMFGPIKQKHPFGLGFPDSDNLDATRQVFDERSFEDWKQRFMAKFGDVRVILNPGAKEKWNLVKIEDEKYQKVKDLFTKGKSAWLDREREAGRSAGLDEATKEYGEKIDKKAFSKLRGKSVKYQGASYKVSDADSDTITLKNDKGDTKTVNLNMFNKSGMIDEETDKPDRCLRIARRKIPQSSAYRSGLIVKCRKGMIWKNEK